MAAKPDPEAPGLSGTPPGRQQQPLDSPRPGGGVHTLGTEANATRPRYAVTVIRYADGGRAVLEFGEEFDLRELFNHVLDRCYDYGWLAPTDEP